MNADEVMEFLDEQLNDLRECKAGEVFLLMKPEEATEEQWAEACREAGVDPA